MLNKIGVNACVLGTSRLNLQQKTDVEQDRAKLVCFQSFLPTPLAEPIDVEQDRVNACVLGTSRLNL